MVWCIVYVCNVGCVFVFIGICVVCIYVGD